MKVVADSHSLLYYLFTPDRLSDDALDALGTAKDTDSVVVSVATFGDLWYSSHKIGERALVPGAFEQLRATVLDTGNTGFRVTPIDAETMTQLASFALAPLRDPWDRMIVATAKQLKLPLVTAYRAITDTHVVDVIW